MEPRHESTVPVPADGAGRELLDIERGDLPPLAGLSVKQAAAAAAGMAGLAALLSYLRRHRAPHRLARARR